MLKIDGNCLVTAGIKFELPQGFFINAEGMEVSQPDGLKLVSPEGDCCINFITTEVEYGSATASLMDIFIDDTLNKGSAEDMFKSNDTGYIWIEEPQKSEINGLKCAYVKFHTNYNYYYEIHFERVAGADRQLEVLLEIPKKYGIDIETVLKRQNVKKFYDSFTLE